MKEKIFGTYAKAISHDGQVHMVTVAGVYKRVKEGSKYKRIFTMAYSICHPDDEFSVPMGMVIAIKRIKRGDIIGSLETNNITMLNSDQCQALVDNEAKHIMANINKYLNKNR